MKKLIITLVMAFTLLFSGSAFAFDASSLSGMYLTPKVGYTYVELDDIHAVNSNAYSHGHDNTAAVGLSVGYDFWKEFQLPVRAELEYMFRDKAVADFGSHRVSSYAHTAMANVAYDFRQVPYVTPYLTAGLGVSWLESGHDDVSYNIGCGMFYDLTENVALDLSLKYIDYGQVRKNGYKMDQKGTNAMFGVRYTF